MDDLIRGVLQDVVRVSRANGVEPVVVGASAMLLAPEIAEARLVFRRTNDVDFAVAVPGWGEFAAIKAGLEKADFKVKPKVEHRLTRNGAIVDLIPFGPECAPKGEFAWPESGLVMNVRGYRAACGAARLIKIGGGLSVRVVTVPGFVLLKIPAFLDRHGRGDMKHRDDAGDIDFWLRNYESGGETRRYEVKNIGFDLAGAGLLGEEIGRLAAEECSGCVSEFLERHADAESPFMDIVARKDEVLGREFGRKARENAVKRVAALAMGLNGKLERISPNA